MAPGSPKWPLAGSGGMWDGWMQDQLGTTGGARSHLLGVFERCYSRGEDLVRLIEWWLWGFGSKHIELVEE